MKYLQLLFFASLSFTFNYAAETNINDYNHFLLILEDFKESSIKKEYLNILKQQHPDIIKKLTDKGEPTFALKKLTENSHEVIFTKKCLEINMDVENLNNSLKKYKQSKDYKNFKLFINFCNQRSSNRKIIKKAQKIFLSKGWNFSIQSLYGYQKKLERKYAITQQVSLEYIPNTKIFTNPKISYIFTEKQLKNNYCLLVKQNHLN